MGDQHTPPGWRYNPSTWQQGDPLIREGTFSYLRVDVTR